VARFWKWFKRNLAPILVGVTAFATAVYAANLAVSGLPTLAPDFSTDLFYDVQSAGTGGKKATGTQISTYVGAASGYLAPPYFQSGNWYNPAGYPSGNIAGTSTNEAANTITCEAGFVQQPVTISHLGANATTTTASNLQFGVYSQSGGNLTLVDSTATVAMGGTSGFKTSGALANSGARDTLNPGILYFFCLNLSAGNQFSAPNANTNIIYSVLGSGTQSHVHIPAATTNGLEGIKWSSTYGTWNSPQALSAVTEVTGTGAVPYIAFQVQ
jgi:hypothetical protein